MGTSGGRPSGTKVSDGYTVGTSGGRPSGTKASDGYSVSGGRPINTKTSDGYVVGTSGGRRTKQITFDDSIELPTEWDISEETLNLSEDLLSACAHRACQQRTFDSKSLGVGICYGCGHILFTNVDNVHTFLIEKPSGSTEHDAPASAYLKAVPNCTLTFVYTERGNSTKGRWYSCANCTINSIPQDQHVGDIMDDSDLKPVDDWDMNYPQVISDLRNKYERGQVSLCGLFSNTVRQAGMSQYSHI